ncbi:ABC transporter ATP-binding protein [Methanococcoides sp.]|uniref:ABC transporter ATP-binding protein n=1 Tax=Methanococcoides sp. TaxID=1966350 RepID=UPI00272EBA64|nr:ABC transporter ATP-binding protein [Methanococcoides sp.]
MVKLNIKNMSFGYASTPIFEDVSIDIQTSELVSIVGPNGAGKSTLLKCINRILTPDSGNLYLDGKNLHEMRRLEVAKNISYVPQSSKRVFSNTVFETVLMGRRPHQGWFSNKGDEEKVWEVLEELEIKDLALAMYDELSGGQQQKVLIARALAQDTGVILLDEPTSNLDIRHQLDVMDITRKLVKERNVAAIMVVHDLNLASRYSDRIIMMRNGKIISVGEPDSVLTCEDIAHVYGVNAEVINRNGGRPYIIPISSIR